MLLQKKKKQNKKQRLGEERVWTIKKDHLKKALRVSSRVLASSGFHPGAGYLDVFALEMYGAAFIICAFSYAYYTFIEIFKLKTSPVCL